MNVRKPKINETASHLEDCDQPTQVTRRGKDAASGALDAELDPGTLLGRGNLDLAARSDQAILGRLTGWNDTRRKSLSCQIEAMKASLAGHSSTVQEPWRASLIAENWLFCCEADQAYAEAAASNWRDSEQALENMKAADHRFLESTKDLANRRKGAPGGSLAGPDQATSSRAGGVLDLATRSERLWLVLIAGRIQSVQEALSLEIRSLKARLDGPSPDLLECMLVDRIVMSMLQCAYLDISFSEWESCHPRLAPHARHRVESAHRGLRASIHALVKVLALGAQETGSVTAQHSAMWAYPATDTTDPLVRRTTSNVHRFDHDVERFLRFAGPSEVVPASEPGSYLSMRYGQPISGFDLQAYTEHVWIQRIAHQDEQHKEALRAHISAIKAELLSGAPTWLGRLLVDRVVICQLQQLYARSILETTANFSEDQATHARKCMDAAIRREVAFTKALSEVRKRLCLSSGSVGRDGRRQGAIRDPLLRST